MSTESAESKGFEILDSVAARALDDEKYRQRLFADPVSVLREAKLVVPDGVKVVVHQNSSDTLHLVLPAGPKRGGYLDLDNVDLREIISWIHF